MKEILSFYAIGEIISVSKIPTGLIHETYKVETAGKDFILQKVHPIFGKAMMEDVDAVFQELMRQGITAQTMARTKEGRLCVEQDGELWRLLTYIPGQVFETVREPAIAYEAGKLLGGFHRALAGFQYEFKHTRPLHHNTVRHLHLLEFAVKNHEDIYSAIRANRRMMEDYCQLISNELPKLFLPRGLRKTITHGDPKITNFIFQNRLAAALIDLDDVGRQHNVLIELGDAFRSWCSRGEEDADNRFDICLFRAALKGYDEGSENFLLAEERALIAQAVKLITLELAARFLRDCFEDSYFGWDPARFGSRREHNLARAAGQIALYRDIVRQERKIFKICR